MRQNLRCLKIVTHILCPLLKKILGRDSPLSALFSVGLLSVYEFYGHDAENLQHNTTQLGLVAAKSKF